MKGSPFCQFQDRSIQPPAMTRRNTLKALAGITASGALATIPGLASALHTKDSLGQNPMQDIEGMLVSIPDVAGETLILNNKSDNDIQINRFAMSNITFDGETIDCNIACDGSAIKISAHDNVLIRFNSTSGESVPSAASENLQMDEHMYRLPAGTRVVPLAASMRGNVAILAVKV